MKILKVNKSGFAHVLLLLIAVFLIVIILGVFQFKKIANKDQNSSGVNEGGNIVKNLGINLDYYNPETGKAGDVEFKKFDTEAGGLDSIFSEYGRLAGANTPQGERRNPQPTFIVSPGTKVHSLVDGKVVNVPKLYSNDYSVHVQPDGSDAIYETEHVINVKVKVGDKVKAGDIVAEASDYDSKNLDGLALVEIGILLPGNPPKHDCIFKFLDSSIKSDTLKKIRALENSWEDFVGDDSIYNQSAEPVPGCSTLDLIEG